MSTISAKLFTNGQNQAVRIPKSMQLEGIKEVNISKKGNSLIITPKKASWLSFAELPEAADDDFMQERQDIFEN